MSVSPNLLILASHAPRRSAIRRSAVGDRSRGQPPAVESIDSKSRSRRGSVSEVTIPSAVAYNMSPRRSSEACSESSEEPSLVSRSSSCDDGCDSDLSPVSDRRDDVDMSMDADDRMFLGYLMSVHVEVLKGNEAMSELDSLFVPSTAVTGMPYPEQDNEFLSEEELLSLLV